MVRRGSKNPFWCPRKVWGSVVEPAFGSILFLVTLDSAKVAIDWIVWIGRAKCTGPIASTAFTFDYSRHISGCFQVSRNTTNMQSTEDLSGTSMRSLGKLANWIPALISFMFKLDIPRWNYARSFFEAHLQGKLGQVESGVFWRFEQEE